MTEPRAQDEAPAVAQLAELLGSHPVWTDATAYLEEGAAGDVYLTSLPDQVWHFVRREGETRLLPGPSGDPDLVLRFTPAAVERLARADGDVGDVAVRLFHLIADAGPEDRVELRVVATFARLVRRGYLSLLAAGGLRVLAFGAAHGVRTLRDLRVLVDRVRGSAAETWQQRAPGGNGSAAPRDQVGLRLRMRRAAREIAEQHDRLREIVNEIHAALASGDGARVVACAASYRDAMQAHFALEEDVIFPALHGLDPRNGGQIEALERDHVGLFAELQALADSAGEHADADWQARFYELRRALALHESREEALVNAAAHLTAR